MKQARCKAGGFTLLELLMVVIIIGILASLALPGFIKASERARASEVVIYFGQVKDSIRRFCLQNNGVAPGGFGALDVEDMSADAQFTARWTPAWPAVACTDPITFSLIATRTAGSACATSTVTYAVAGNSSTITYGWAGACL